ncbi:MAG: DNA primase [Bacteroidales bacterium]|nr:DNA primase [Bacteroidales bacterium]
MIRPETIEKILDTVRIEEIVGDFVTLKRRGANLLGCCPFHNEKTPSFTVSPAKGIFKCFGCGEAGNSVHFLMKHEHFSYPEALRYIANKYNIEIEEEALTPQQLEKQTEREALLNVSDFAQKYFADLLYNNEMGQAIGLSYFYERGLTDVVIKRFGLGYCIDEWDNFTNHATQNGYSLNVLEKTGLTIVKENGKKYDRFRGRVMFPVFSVSGKCLGFSGRILSSEKQAAKYVNSPESEIYNKSRTLYGIFQAKGAISKQDLCYLVEGNIDVITMHQAGIENTVASSGTSLTMEQIRLISRYTKNITVLYDGDAAGIKAAFRAVNMLLEEGMRVRVVLFPDGEDPDSYTRKYGAEKIQAYVTEQATNFIIFKTKILLEETKGDPIKKAALIKDIVQTIALVPELIERNIYVKECASLLDISEQTLATELAKCIVSNRKKQFENAAVAAAATPSPAEQLPANDYPTPNPDIPADQQGPTPDEAERLKKALITDGAADPLEVYERKLISLLMNSGTSTIKQPAKDEQGNDIEEENYVSAIIVGDLMADELDFKNPVYQTIYETYKNNLLEGRMVDADYFLQQDNIELANLAATLLTNTYNVSDNWMERYQIYVPTMDDNLEKDLKQSLLRFKQMKLEERINALSEKLKDEQTDDELTLLLHQIAQMKKVKVLICKELNQIITS